MINSRLMLTVVAAVMLAVFTNVSEAKEKTVDPSGTWRLEYDWNGTQMKDAFHLNVDDKGKVTGNLYRNDNEPKEIKEGKVEGDTLSFKMSGEYNGNEWVAKFSGKIDGDELDGQCVLEGGGQSYDLPWKPKRSVELNDVVGTWDIRIEGQDGTVYEPTLTIAGDGDKFKGDYKSKVFEQLQFEVKDVRVETNHLMFTATGSADGNTLTVNYKGRPYGDKMKGTLAYEVGDYSGENDFAAKRKKK